MTEALAATGIPSEALEALRAREATIAFLRLQCLAVEVTTNEQAEQARELLVKLKTFKCEVDAERKALGDPLRLQVNEINAAYNVPRDAADALIEPINAKLSGFALAAAEEQRKAFAAASALHASGDNTAARAALAVNNEAAAKQMPKGSSVREVWVGEIFAPDDVPREYCTPNEKQIAALGRATPAAGSPPAIAGVRWVRRADVRVTTPRKRKMSQ